jgi:hypothetical protein
MDNLAHLLNDFYKCRYLLAFTTSYPFDKCGSLEYHPQKGLLPDYPWPCLRTWTLVRPHHPN